MSQTFEKSSPIYLQLVDRMKRRIVNGELTQGEKMPSVRKLAIHFQINPNTVQRTYAEMERLGIIENRRGHGSFVTDNPETLTQLRDEIKHQQIHDFVHIMKEAGFGSADILQSVQQYLEEEK